MAGDTGPLVQIGASDITVSGFSAGTTGNVADATTTNVIPEPSTATLLVLSIGAVLVRRRKPA